MHYHRPTTALGAHLGVLDARRGAAVAHALGEPRGRALVCKADDVAVDHERARERRAEHDALGRDVERARELGDARRAARRVEELGGRAQDGYS